RGGRLVAETALDLETHADRAVLGQVADHVVGIDDLDIVVNLDVSGGNHANTGLLQRQHRGIAAVHADGDVLQVQQDFDDVFLQSFHRRVLVQHTVNLDLGDREAGDGRQQHATQRVAEGMAITALERFDHDPGASGTVAFDADAARTQHLVCGYRHGQ